MIRGAPTVRPRDLLADLDSDPAGARLALSRSLERQMVALCARAAPYYIEAAPMCQGAPDSLRALLDATRATVAAESDEPGTILAPDGRMLGQRIPVDTAHSIHTIWSRPEMNWIARAWHDSCHILLAAGFEQCGELAVARAQCAQIEGKPERAIMWAETAAQAAYRMRYGRFPARQRAFVRDVIRFGLKTTLSKETY